MLLLMGGLIFWKTRGGDEPKPPPTAPIASTAPVDNALEESVPPPPAEEDAGAAPTDTPKTAKKTGGGGGGCEAECRGTASADLQSALRGKAGQARGCYERALRQNATLEGRLVVNVRVGPRGQVCSAGVATDALHDAAVSQCVVQMFRSAVLPAPAGGCVDTAVPMNFKPKT
jgi:outer membrane biosynthesis protein TonB